MTTQPLKHVAEVRFSSVDKKSVDGQLPVRLCNYTDVYYNDRIVADMPFMEATATPDQVARFSLRAGDVLLTKDSETADDIGVSALVAEDLPDVLCGYHLAIARPRDDAIDGRFLRWALTASSSRGQLEVAATGVTRFGLRQDSVAGMLVPAPAPAAQVAIADYLDTATAMLDRVVAIRGAQVRLLDLRARVLLRERLAGCGPQIKLRRVATIAHGASEPVGGQKHGDSDIPFVSVADFNLPGNEERIVAAGRWTTLQFTATGRIPTAPAGSVLFPRVGAALLTNARRVTMSASVIDNPILACIPSLVDTDFLYYWLRTIDMASVSNPGPVPSVSEGQVLELELPLPARADQERIVADLRWSLAQSDSLALRMRAQIARLAERRQALITAAVTGQLEIPGVAA